MRRTLHPAILREPAGPKENRARATGILHVLLLHGLQSSCMLDMVVLHEERRRSLHGRGMRATENPCLGGTTHTHLSTPKKCPRQQLALLQHIPSPLLRQDPRRASYMRYHSPCFQGRVPAFPPAHGVMLKLAKEKRKEIKTGGGYLSAYTDLIDRGCTNSGSECSRPVGPWLQVAAYTLPCSPLLSRHYSVTKLLEVHPECERLPSPRVTPCAHARCMHVE